MRKLLALLSTTLFLLFATAVIYLITLPKSAAPSTETIEVNPERLARGDYLFNAVLGCPVCHSERDYS
ncbi:MAG: cytochrome C, partial [Chromatiales bacterium]|nr:cytochrome C [Chromatiales bacterium]